MFRRSQYLSTGSAGFVAAAMLLSAPAAALKAQRPHAVDTAAVLAAVTTTWAAMMAPGAGERPAGGIWYVRASDTLTRAFAAAVKQPTRPAPPTLLCPFDAPPGAVSGLLTYVEFRAMTPERVIVSVANSCTRTVRSAVGGFYQAEHFEVLRGGGTWVARHAGMEIS